MTLLNNLRVLFKIGLVALILRGTMIALVAHMASGMSVIDRPYLDLVPRVDSSTTLVARVAQRAES